MRNNLNSGLIALANSNAISLCAYVHQYLQDLATIHIALVACIRFFTDMVNDGTHCSILIQSNLIELKFGLCIPSRTHKKFNVDLDLNQFQMITHLFSSHDIIQVREMYSQLSSLDMSIMCHSTII